MRLGRHDQAWKLYDKAIRLGKMDAFREAAAMYEAGLAADRAGQADQAAMLLRRALWCNPRHSLAKEARSRLKIEE